MRVVYYHSVLDRHDAITPDRFAAHLDAYLNAGFRFADPFTRAQGDARDLLLHFDDGYADNLTVAAPILAERSIRATMFMVTSMIGRDSSEGNRLYADRPMASSEQLLMWVACGHRLGSHTHTHRNAATMQADGELKGELRRSIEVLRAHGAKGPLTFAYPNGQRGSFSRASHQTVIEAGFDHAWTTLWGPVDMRSSVRSRIWIPDDATAEQALAKVRGREDWRWLAHRIRRGARRW